MTNILLHWIGWTSQQCQVVNLLEGYRCRIDTAIAIFGQCRIDVVSKLKF